MSDISCRYQRVVSPVERAAALDVGRCEHCGITLAELTQQGQTLEVCAEELGQDLATGHRVLTPVPLCSVCHRAHHEDARGTHNPCQIKARLSREHLD